MCLRTGNGYLDAKKRGCSLCALGMAGVPDFMKRSKRVGENGCIEPTSGTCGYLIRDLGSSDLVREEQWSVQNERGSGHFKHSVRKNPFPGAKDKHGSRQSEGCCLSRITVI